MNRRTMLTRLLGAGMLAGGSLGHAAGLFAAGLPRRLVSLDWGLTEMLLSLGVVPVGMANVPGFRRNFTACTLPAAVVDLGLMFQPNLELLWALKPELIIITPAHAALRASLEKVAPTLTLGRYRASPVPYLAARAETQQLAAILGREASGANALAQVDAAVAQARRQLMDAPATHIAPLYMVRFVDETHLRVYSTHSLYGEIMTLLGLHNAWPDTSHAAAFSTVGFEALGSAPEAALIYLKPLPVPVAKLMERSVLWQAMPFKNPGRMLALPSVPAEGGIVSAAYFAQVLSDVLVASADQQRKPANAAALLRATPDLRRASAQGTA